MSETTSLIELSKNVGTPILVFIIWVLYHKSSMKILERMIGNQSEESKRNYEALKEITETNQCVLVALARMEQKIDTNTFCPLVKERRRKPND